MLKEFRQERIEFARAHKIAEKQLLPIFRKALSQSIAPVLKQAEQYGIDGLDPEVLIDRNVWTKAYQDAYTLIGMKIAKQEFYRQRKRDGTAKASAIDFLGDIWTKTLRDYALKYTYDMQRELNHTTIEVIRKALNDSYILGLDRYGRVRLLFDQIKANIKSRSLTISRTETTTIANLGKDIGARGWIEQQGGKGYKIWLGRIIGERPEHLETNDTIIPIDDYYDMDGHLCERPGDVTLPARLRINCRCTQSFISQNAYSRYQKRGRIVDGKLIGAS